MGPSILAAICVTGVCGSFGQSSASPAQSVPPAASQAQRVAHAAANAAPAAIADKGPLPDPKSILSAVLDLATTARDTAAKVNVRVPIVTGVGYLDPAYRTPVSQSIPAPKYNLPAHPRAGCTYTENVIYSDIYAADIKQPNKKKQGKILSVGKFPDAHVSALAFGSIPVTATLHTQQIRRHGKLVPLSADTITSFTTTSANGNSCDPGWETGGAYSPPSSTVSRGQLDTRVSDLRVDKQLVDVGPDCHTATPLQINLSAGPGYLNFLNGGQLIQTYDPSTVDNGGSVYPKFPGSSNLTIPRFVDCRNPKTGEDISRLLTSAVSGNRNTLTVDQSVAILNGINNHNVTLCQAGMGCVKRPKYLNPPKPGMTVTRAH